jgi:hypothetical protein
MALELHARGVGRAARAVAHGADEARHCADAGVALSQQRHLAAGVEVLRADANSRPVEWRSSAHRMSPLRRSSMHCAW